jgi:outer membrane lipopolysaccharide assembly protein LptE/RlpB
MANQTLKNQFFTALESSKAYSVLNPEEKKQLADSYADVTDEQYTQALAELQKFASNNAKLEEELLQKAQELKELIKKVELETRKSNEEKEVTEASNAADQLLDKLGAIVDEKEKPKRKKFLGMF